MQRAGSAVALADQAVSQAVVDVAAAVAGNISTIADGVAAAARAIARDLPGDGGPLRQRPLDQRALHLEIRRR